MIKFKNENQFKAFIKKEAERLDISMINAYKTFVARTLLERISKYNDNSFIIKGSVAEASYIGRLLRCLTDIDIATLDDFYNNYNLFNDIITDTTNDLFLFKYLTNIKRRYSGIYKISLSAQFKSFKQPISIDVQDNYQRLIEPTFKIMPTIFEGDEPFSIYTISYEEYLAEKLCVIIESSKEEKTNMRIKDFYDVYQLYGGKYNYDKLTMYFKKMCELRHLSLEEMTTQVLNKEFINRHSNIFDKTKNKMNFIDKEINLEGAMYYTKAVLDDQLQRLRIKK